MLYINESIKQKIKKITKENCYIVADFDRTITKGNSKTSWSILANSNLVPKRYKEERQELYEYYRPKEIDMNLKGTEKQQLMKEWYLKHIELFVKYAIHEDIIKQAAKNVNIMEFRKGAKDFLTYLHQEKIPVIIISAGIGNFIKEFLMNHNCYFDNIYISSNMLKFKEGIASDVENNIIHSLNKNEVSLPEKIKNRIQKRESIILLGDGIEDIKMVEEEKRENTLRIGFVAEDTCEMIKNYQQYFDIVCEDTVSYHEIGELLFHDFEKIIYNYMC